MAKDLAPLYFEARLGMLKPANVKAEAALREIKGRVRVEIKGGSANQRRRGLYWTVAAIVAPLLNEQHGMTIDDDDLHDITRDKLKMFDEVKLPSGEVHRKHWSTKNSAMNEADRADFTTKALALWSTWTGIDVADLRREGELEAS
jgi:hypothetical protein